MIYISLTRAKEHIAQRLGEGRAKPAVILTVGVARSATTRAERRHESGTFAGRIERQGLRSIRWLLGVEHVVLVADVDLRLEMRRLEVIVADFEHLPESQVRTGAMTRQVRRRQRSG